MVLNEDEYSAEAQKFQIDQVKGVRQTEVGDLIIAMGQLQISPRNSAQKFFKSAQQILQISRSISAPKQPKKVSSKTPNHLSE